MIQKNNKSDIRKQYKAIRAALSPVQKKQYSEKLCTAILSCIKQHKIHQHIALFAGTQDEPDITSLTQYTDHKWCFPKIQNMDTGVMEFFEVQNIQELHPSPFGILEPKDTAPLVSAQSIGLFCVPAVCIDQHGTRVGMGGGFYDRYLPHNTHAKKLGIIFPEQISENPLPADEWDEAVEVLVV